MTEGYIKFSCDWVKTEPLPHQDIQELNAARKKLYELKLIGACEDGIGYGNISRRYKDVQFIISGSATGNVENTNEEHYTLITEFNIDKNYVKCRGPVIASSETMTHAALYQMSREVNCIIHIHNITFWNNSINKLPSTIMNAEYGTPEMAYEIERLWNEGKFIEKKIIIMSGHEAGIIVFGSDISSVLNDTINIYNSSTSE